LIGIFAANAGKYFGLDYFLFRKRPAAQARKRKVQQKAGRPQEEKNFRSKNSEEKRVTDIPKGRNNAEEEQKEEESLEEERMKY
jgi:hypothetical protein